MVQEAQAAFAHIHERSWLPWGAALLPALSQQVRISSRIARTYMLTCLLTKAKAEAKAAEAKAAAAKAASAKAAAAAKAAVAAKAETTSVLARGEERARLEAELGDLFVNEKITSEEMERRLAAFDALPGSAAVEVTPSEAEKRESRRKRKAEGSPDKDAKAKAAQGKKARAPRGSRLCPPGTKKPMDWVRKPSFAWFCVVLIQFRSAITADGGPRSHACHTPSTRTVASAARSVCSQSR